MLIFIQTSNNLHFLCHIIQIHFMKEGLSLPNKFYAYFFPSYLALDKLVEICVFILKLHSELWPHAGLKISYQFCYWSKCVLSEVLVWHYELEKKGNCALYCNIWLWKPHGITKRQWIRISNDCKTLQKQADALSSPFLDWSQGVRLLNQTDTRHRGSPVCLEGCHKD